MGGRDSQFFDLQRTRSVHWSNVWRCYSHRWTFSFLKMVCPRQALMADSVIFRYMQALEEDTDLIIGVIENRVLARLTHRTLHWCSRCIEGCALHL